MSDASYIMAENACEETFPWHLGVYDAHCHPTDTMSSVSSIPNMKTRCLTIMATRSQDQELVTSVSEKYYVKSDDPETWTKEECVIPCFGWHPWFSHQMYFGNAEGEGQGGDSGKELQGDEKIKHYQSVLRPSKEDPTDEDRQVFLSLPDPMPFQRFLSQTRKLLEQFPYALVGEIGLDRTFRIPEAWISELEEKRNKELTLGGREGRKLTPFRVDMAHQKKIVKMQLQLAAEMNRAVSMHGVQAHGMVFEVVKELYDGHEKKVLSKRERKKRGTDNPAAPNDETEEKQERKKPYPPRVCLHSYSGNASNFKQYLNPAIPVEIFASFSTAINLGDAMEEETPKEFEEMIKTVPDDMLLVESDLHTAGDRMDERLEDIIRRICKIKEWSLEDGVKQLAKNWRRFVFGGST